MSQRSEICKQILRAERKVACGDRTIFHRDVDGEDRNGT